MLYASILFFFYFLLPAISGYAAHVKASPRERVRYRQRFRRVRRWKKPEYATAFFVLTTATFFLVGLLVKVGVKFPSMYLLVLLAVNCVGALAFLFYYWDAPKIWSKYGGLLKALFVPMAIGVATLSKIYSDAGIAELSGLAPQDLPGAQLFLTLILTPVIWLIVFSLTMGYASLPLMPILLIRELMNDSRRKRAKLSKKDRPGPTHITAMMAVFLCAVLSLTIMQKVVSKHVYESRLRQAIVFSSFHLPSTFCGLPEVKGVSVAPMSDDRAAVAIPDTKLTYRFVLITCKPAAITDQDASRLLGDAIKD